MSNIMRSPLFRAAKTRALSRIHLSPLVLISACAGSLCAAAEPATQPTTATTQPASAPVSTETPALPPPMPALPTAGQQRPATQPTTMPIISTTSTAPTAPPPTTQPTSQSAPQSMPSAGSPPPVETAASNPAAGPVSNPPADRLHEVVVSTDVDRTRDQIAPSLGAVTYSIGPNQIQNIPGGENAPFQQVLLRAPGVVQDSFGQEHVRGEHANLTFRVNGVLLPEGIGALGGFGQELDTRIVNSVTLIDGTLPAQFGFRTAGIVDVSTKSGAALNNNQLSFYGGSFDTFQPSLQLGGSDGKLDYFVSGSYRYTGLGIENPTSSNSALHDYANQERLFTYLGYRIDDTSRLMLLLNASYSAFGIPDSPGVPPAFSLAGHPTFNSTMVNENQSELDNYEVLSYQKSLDKLTFQASVFSRYGRIRFTPDPIGDLIFQGVASRTTNGFLTNGGQLDASYVLDNRNTLRFGLIGDYTDETLKTNTAVFAVDAAGNPASDVPLGISDNHGNWGAEFGLYLQDEWKISEHFTLNYGARYDRFDSSFDHEDQISPRANLVWKIDDATAAHVGYAKYFVPPPVQFVKPSVIAAFAGTTNTPENFRDDSPRVERSDYYDVGISRQITPPWQVTLDGFYKVSRQLVDEGQFGSAIIESPFNYRQGKQYGAEISSTFKKGGLSLFGNFAWVKAMGRDIDSNQYLIGNDELAFIKGHYIPLDHESEYTASGGASYTWRNDRVYADILYGSGLRAGFANDRKEPLYYPVNIGYEHIFHPLHWGVKDVRLRFDVVNVFDQVYQLRDGSGIGVGAAQFGERRGFFAGLAFNF